MRPPASEGRTVRDLNGDALDAVAQAQRQLEGALRALSAALGSHDPVDYLKADKAAIAIIADAQEQLRAAVATLQSIEEICAANAVRGPRKEAE